MKKLAVITTYFNYSKSKLVKFAYERFADNLKKQGVDLYTVELAFEDDNFQLPKSHNTFRLRSNSILWHKEARFNYALERLPKDVTSVAWLDADIIIHNNNWAHEVNEILDTFNIVQIGGLYRFLTQKGDVDHVRETAVKVLVESPTAIKKKQLHVGLAWAGRRDVLDKIKFFDYDIVGGNDTIMFASCVSGPNNFIANWLIDKVIAKNSPPLLAKIKEYHKKCWDVVRGKVSYLPVTVDHIFHSAYENRQYVTRYDCIKGFDPEIDLIREKNGLFSWSNKNFESKMKSYFITKDSTTILQHKKVKDVTLGDNSKLITLHITFDPEDYTPILISHDRSKGEDSYDPILDREIDQEVKDSIRKLIRFRRGLSS